MYAQKPVSDQSSGANENYSWIYAYIARLTLQKNKQLFTTSIYYLTVLFSDRVHPARLAAA